jgi:hypothetical protein
VRKAILVVALIGASFAGGAVVNGPGLVWAQSYLTHQLGGDAPPPVDDDLAAPSIEEIPLDDDSPPGGALPAAPLPPLEAGAVAASPVVDAPAPAPAPAPTPAVEEPAPIDVSAADPPLSGPSVETAADDVPPPPAPSSAPSESALEAEEEPESAAWKDAPDTLAPARPILPGSPASPNAADPEVAAAGLTRAEGSESWGRMRQKLREAGVSRYWIEGELGGNVRLRCLIPLAGQRAVGQQFEAEGASESLAAEGVLRRIALWKATETP